MILDFSKQRSLQWGILITLAVSIFALLQIVFSIINLSFPDAIDQYYYIENNFNDILIGISILIVFFPVFLFLTKKVKEQLGDMADTDSQELTRLQVLVAGGFLLGDLATVIYTWLGGELSDRFLFKALALLLVMGLVFYYYTEDTKGVWQEKKELAKYFSWLTVALVALVVVGGVYFIKSPTEARETGLDSRQISDLQAIQQNIVDFMNSDDKLPETLAELPYAPIAPKERTPYRYEVTDNGFVLCATFYGTATSTDRIVATDYKIVFPINSELSLKNANDWRYESGEYCFERELKELSEEEQSVLNKKLPSPMPVEFIPG
jgi:hypothetical protein